MNNSFVAIDFETLYQSRISVCSVAAVKFINGQITDTYYTLIEPDWDALEMYEHSQTFEYIHGIKNSELIGQPSFLDILPILEQFADNLPLVAHNASFEKSCIEALLKHYNVNTTLDYEHMLDTMKISKDVEKRRGIKIVGRGTHTLDTLCKMYEIVLENHHNALDDSVSCGQLLVKMNERLEMPIEELKKIEYVLPDILVEKHKVAGTGTLEEIINS